MQYQKLNAMKKPILGITDSVWDEPLRTYRPIELIYEEPVLDDTGRYQAQVRLKGVSDLAIIVWCYVEWKFFGDLV